ncbi:MAG: hypothetical protein ACAH83_18190 [Alphaproteobacteria bacterium]
MPMITWDHLKNYWYVLKAWLDERPPVRKTVQFVLCLIGGFYLITSAFSLIGALMEVVQYFGNFFVRRAMYSGMLSSCRDTSTMQDCSQLAERNGQYTDWAHYSKNNQLYISWEGRKHAIYSFIQGALQIFIAKKLGAPRADREAAATQPSAPQPDAATSEMSPRQAMGLFILMTGIFLIVGSGYFFYDTLVKIHHVGQANSAFYMGMPPKPTSQTISRTPEEEASDKTQRALANEKRRLDRLELDRKRQQLRDAKDDINRRRITQEISDLQDQIDNEGPQSVERRRWTEYFERLKSQMSPDAQEKIGRESMSAGRHFTASQVMAAIGIPLIIAGFILKRKKRP